MFLLFYAVVCALLTNSEAGRLGAFGERAFDTWFEHKDICDSSVPARKILYFTYKFDLLSRGHQLDDFEKVNAENVRHTLTFFPDVEVRFETDESCERILRGLSGMFKDLLTFFQNEKRGMYKSDICRGALLFLTGGMYMDVDLEVQMDVRKLISTNTSFTTVYMRTEHGEPYFFQAFIYVDRPCHPVIYQYLQDLMAYYRGFYKWNGVLVGVQAMGTAFKKWQKQLDLKIQFQEYYNHTMPANARYIHKRTGNKVDCNVAVYDHISKKVPFYSRAIGASVGCPH